MISQIVRKNYAINIYDIYYMGSTKKREKMASTQNLGFQIPA